MKKINKILVIFFLLFITNHAQSEKHNQVSVELDRIKNDIIDLQKFVYKNESSLNNSNDSDENIELDELKILMNDISKSINSLEKQILDIKDDVSNLYSLYTSSDFDEKKITNILFIFFIKILGALSKKEHLNEIFINYLLL